MGSSVNSERDWEKTAGTDESPPLLPLFLAPSSRGLGRQLLKL